MENYRYNICFENSITEGYVTEKLLEAKVAGCIPLYYGDDSAAIDFNNKCYINSREMANADDMLRCVNELENKDLFIRIASEQLFNVEPDLNALYFFLRGAMKI